MAYQLINLGNGTYGAHDTATGMARSFSSEANAKQFLGVNAIDYAKAAAPTFDFNQLLGANADKLINVAPKVQGPSVPTPTQVLQNNTSSVYGQTSQAPQTQNPAITAPPSPGAPQLPGQPQQTNQPLNTPQTMPAATTQNLAQGGIQGLIGTRKSAINPNVDEYFNTQTGQGFADPAQLFDFVGKQTGQKINSFDQVGNLMKTSSAPSSLGSGASAGTAGSATTAATGATGDGAGGELSPQDTVKKYTDDYKKVLTDLGVPTLKTTIDDTAKALNDINDKKLLEVQGVNDNPWLDENSRRKSIANIDERYQGKLQLQTDLLTLYNNQYSEGLKEAGTIFGQIETDYRTTQENATKALEANQAIVQNYGVNSEWYTVDGTTIIKSSNGKTYPTYDSWVADGGGPNAKVQKIGGLMTLKDQANFDIALQNANTSRINALKSGGSGGGSGIGGSIISQGSAPQVSPTLDAAVADIIRNNPGEWGHAADQIDQQFGPGTATKYDSWLKSVYSQGQNIDEIYQPQQIGNLRSIDISRLSTASNRIVSNYVKSPAYTAVASAVPFIQRLGAAKANPGSVSDADLLDSLIKINTGGGQITEAQARLITQGRSLKDTFNVLQKKTQNGGVLSDDQRQQAFALATQVFKNYQNAYAPIYKQATAQLQQANIPQSLWTIPDWNTLVGQIPQESQGGAGTTSTGLNYTIIP